MSRSDEFRRRFRLRSRGADERAREVDEEMEAHLSLRVDALRHRGVDTGEARREAERRFGGDLAGARRRLRDSAGRRDAALHRRERLGALRQDVGYAVRQAARAPGFTALAVGTLALAIGATTAIFSLVDRVLLRPLPFAAPERLVALQSMAAPQAAGEGRDGFPLVSAANWMDWRAASRTLAGTALVSLTHPLPVQQADGAVRVPSVRTSGGYFALLGVPMLVGRGYTEAEAQAGEPLAVVRESYWRRAMGASPRLDAPLRIGDRSYTVVGVVPDERAHPEDAELWLASRIQPGSGAARNWISWLAVARLAPGRTIAEARAELGVVAADIRARDPEGIYSYGVGVVPLAEQLLGGAPKLLRLLLGAVAAVLLVACANLAAANLARGVARGRELAVRAALGAGRARLLQQLLVEQVALALAGGLVGLLVASALVRVLAAIAAERIPRLAGVGLDGRVLLFAVGTSLLAGLLSGLAPALRLSRVSLRARLAAGGRGASGARHGTGLVLVGGEVALALLLLAGAGLLLRSLQTLLARDLGFETRGVVTADAAVAGSSYGGDTLRHAAYWDDALSRLRAIPGVTAASAANGIPLTRGVAGFIDVAGRPLGAGDGAGYRLVGDDYFRTIGVPLLAGRDFGPEDRAGTPRVVVVNAAMAAEYWPGESALGKQVRARSFEGGPDGDRAPWLTVVGVVGDVRHSGFEDDAIPEMYTLYRQVPARAGVVQFVVRTERPTAEVAAEVRRGLREVDPRIAVEIGTLDAALGRSLAERRFPVLVLSGFGALALLIAALGLYGVLSFIVSQRTRELAVRAALGAERGRLLRLVLGQALGVLVGGAAVGLLAGLYLSRYLAELLVDVTPTDAAAFGAAAALLLAVGLVAALVPARRATRVNPLLALSAE